MGIFTRFRDIVGSNINAMLDKAEDPEKLIRLMIQEMEETLIELKASCAKTMASCSKTGRELDAVEEKAELWSSKAELAVTKGRDDLAREGLLERRRWLEKAESLREDLTERQAVVEACREDIAALEEKLVSAKERRRTLVARHRHARGRKRAGNEIRRVDSADTLLRFEQFENRIERLEAEAELAGPHAGARPAPDEAGGPQTLEDKFKVLEADEEIETELASIRARIKGGADPEETPAPKAGGTE